MSRHLTHRASWLVALCLVVLGTSACSREQTGPSLPDSPESFAAAGKTAQADATAAAPPPTSQNTASERAPLRRQQSYPASTEAARSSTLTAEVAGLVSALRVEEGDLVETGQVIAQIDVRQYELQSGQANAAVRAAEVQRDTIKKEWERFKALAEKGAVPGIEFDRLDAQLAQAEAAVSQARAGARVTKHVAGESKVIAPFRGVISKRHAAEGSMASPGAPLVTLVEVDTLRVRGQLPAELLDDVAPGDIWLLRLPALNREVEVSIERVLPFVDPTTRRFEVLASLPNPDHRLATGLFGEMRPRTAADTTSDASDATNDAAAAAAPEETRR